MEPPLPDSPLSPPDSNSAPGSIDDIADNSTQALTIDGRALLLVKHRGELYLYENNCPHANETLDPMGGSLSNAGGDLIRCQRHGAEFLASDGECVGGPCLGERLTAVPFTPSGGAIYLD